MALKFNDFKAFLLIGRTFLGDELSGYSKFEGWELSSLWTNVSGLIDATE